MTSLETGYKTAVLQWHARGRRFKPDMLH